MIVGIGTDLVDVARIAGALARHGDRFRHRLLAPAERRVFASVEQEAAFLARRWAAKEAVAKAFGTGIGGELSFQDIVVAHDASGRPRLEFTGAGGHLAARLGVARAHLSVSDERGHALAFVVLES